MHRRLSRHLQVLTLICTMTMALACYGDKPHKQKSHHHKHRRGGSGISHISISPSGFHYGYQSRDFGFSIGTAAPFFPVAQPTLAVAPPPFIGPEVVVPAPQFAPAGVAPIHEPTFAGFQRDAVLAFRSGQYLEAQRLIEHALIEDPSHPYLLLFASQIHFANGNYQRAALEVESAISVLHQNEWDVVIRDFANLYGRNDYVIHMDRLEQHCDRNPKDAYAIALRGFHFGCLGHADAARRDFELAIAVDPNNPLANRLKDSLGNPVAPTPIQAPEYNDPNSQLKSVIGQ